MNSLLPLPPHHLHLWVLLESEVHDAGLLARYHSLMSEDEKARQARFRFAADRHRYLLTRALIRTVLSRYTPVEPHAWRFTEDSYGRPDAAGLEQSGSKLSFNISHAAGVIACGVTKASTIGVDLESFAREPLPLDVAEGSFSAAEVTTLHSLSPANQRQRFFEYWTLKESYLKAIGKGLSVPLHELSFDLNRAGEIDVTFANPLADDPKRWQFILLKVFAAHLLAVCVDRRQGTTNRLVVRKSIPTLADADCDAALLRQVPAIFT